MTPAHPSSDSIALSADQMQPRYHTVIIGSGYGGSVAAMRLAKSGRKVCVLEKGREFLAGAFPGSFGEVLKQSEVHTRNQSIGTQSSLYQFHIGQDLVVGVANGLGGGSLVNSGVITRPSAETFNHPKWPKAIRNCKRLELGYEQALENLDGHPYPGDWPALKKFELLQQAGRSIKTETSVPPITISFKDGKNQSGRERKSCNLCGQCNSGCNNNSKNSLDTTYLFQARQNGAQIFCNQSVTFISKLNDGWRIEIKNNSGIGRRNLRVHARNVILAAGSLGTSKILLASSKQGLSLSPKVGENFLTNGTMLGVGMNTPKRTNARALSSEMDPDHPVGPGIVGAMKAYCAPLNKYLLIEDGAHPSFAVGLMKLGLTLGQVKNNLTRSPLSFTNEIKHLTPAKATDKLHRSMNWLVVGDDEDFRTIGLSKNRLIIGKGTEKGSHYRKEVNVFLKKLSRNIGADYLEARGAVTFHPLGGASMAECADDGVVDHRGRVFDCVTADSTHRGLYVMDGSIFPKAIGENPLLSICAFAERNMTFMLDELKTERNEASSYTTDETVDGPAGAKISFNESMKGFLKSSKTSESTLDGEIEFDLAVSLPVDAFDSNVTPYGELSGLISIPSISNSPMPVFNGRLGLLDQERSTADSYFFKYEFDFESPAGDSYHFVGQKVIKGTSLIDGWKQTTHMPFELIKVSERNSVLAYGLLNISLAGFLKLLSTLSVAEAKSRFDSMSAISKFGAYFTNRILSTYFPQWSGKIVEKIDSKSFRHPAGIEPEEFSFETEDGVALTLQRFKGGNRAPVVLAHGYSSTSGVFAIDTIDQNLLEYLCNAGHDVWLFSWRAAGDMPSAKERFSLDLVARYDWPAAAKKIKEVTGSNHIQYVAHCIGAQTLLMSALGGRMDHLVGSMYLMQVGAHWEGKYLLEKLKIRSGIPNLLDRIGVKHFPSGTTEKTPSAMKVVDAALRFYPIRKPERCGNPACRRHAFLFGELLNHKQLNTETHDRMGVIIQNASVSGFKQLARIARAGHVVNARGEDVYLPNIGKLRFPISFLYGADNGVCGPGTTKKTYEALRRANPGQKYSWRSLRNYGHMDVLIGKNASRDVFPLIEDHLDRHMPDHISSLER